MDELLKQLDIRGLSWRSLLLAGVLPTLLLVFCLVFYTSGWQGCLTVIADTAEFKTKWKEIAGTLISFLALSLVFLSIRTTIFTFCRRLPIPLMHQWALFRYARMRRAAERKKEVALWKISVARWYRSGFIPRVFVPDMVRCGKAPRDRERAEQEIAALRRAVADARRFSPLHSWRLQRALGWLHLMAAMRCAIGDLAAEFSRLHPGNTDEENWFQAEDNMGFHAPGEWVLGEIAAWREIFKSDKRAAERIKALDQDRLYDSYGRAFRRFEQFPTSEWVEPTLLGNTMAALEDYSTTRYGVDTSLLWSRVERIIPKDQADQVYSSQIAVFALLNCFVAMLMAGFICLFRFSVDHVYRREQLLQQALATASAFFLSWIFSRFAVFAAGQLRVQMESRIDLYTPRWLSALGLLPKDIVERNRMIVALGEFANGTRKELPNFALQPLDPLLDVQKSK